MSAFPASISPEEYQLLDEFISGLVGIHYPSQKMELLESKLRPRVQELRLSSFMDYYLLLQYQLETEIDVLSHLVTNNETYFFRETYQFQALFEAGLPDLLKSSGGGSVRFLCAGCSSGEEAYTLNIFAGRHRLELAGAAVGIEAFDIDRKRVEIARRAEYRPRSLRMANEEQIRTYFLRSGAELYSLRAPYRNGVGFHHGNVLEPTTFPGSEPFDAIFCRNVLIYFSEPAVHRAVDAFSSRLRPGGLLFLGHSESIIGMTPELEPVRLERCIAYKKV